MSNSLLQRQGIGSSLGLMLHEATKIHPGLREFRREGPADEPGGWAQRLWPCAWQRPAWQWPSAPAQQPVFEQVLAQRRSTRNFAPSALSAIQFGQFLHAAYPAEVSRETYQAAQRPHQQLEAWNGHVTLARAVLLVQRVEGLASGAYLVDERCRTLRPLAVDLQGLPSLLEQACFQAEFRDAAVLCLMVGSIEDALQRYGDRGYRYLLLENGVQAQRFGLAAAAAGLGGCISGSFVQGLWEDWLGLDGFSGTVLNGFALGVDADLWEKAHG